MPQHDPAIHADVDAIAQFNRNVNEAMVAKCLAAQGTTAYAAVITQKDRIVALVRHALLAGRVRADDRIRFDFLEKQYEGVVDSSTAIAKALGYENGSSYRRMRGECRLLPKARERFDKAILPNMPTCFPPPEISRYYSLIEALYVVQTGFLRKPSERLDVEWMMCLLGVWSRSELNEHLGMACGPTDLQALEELVQLVKSSTHSRPGWDVMSQYHLPHVCEEWRASMSISLWARDELKLQNEMPIQ